MTQRHVRDVESRVLHREGDGDITVRGWFSMAANAPHPAPPPPLRGPTSARDSMASCLFISANINRPGHKPPLAPLLLLRRTNAGARSTRAGAGRCQRREPGAGPSQAARAHGTRQRRLAWPLRQGGSRLLRAPRLVVDRARRRDPVVGADVSVRRAACETPRSHEEVGAAELLVLLREGHATIRPVEVEAALLPFSTHVAPCSDPHLRALSISVSPYL